MNTKQGLFLLTLTFLISCNNSENTPSTIDDPAQTDSIETSSTSTTVPTTTSSEFKEGAFEEVNPAALNAKLAEATSKLSPEDVVKMHYPAKTPNHHGTYEKIDVQTKQEGDKTIVTLTHDNQPHITVQGHRIVMTMQQKEKQWEVLSIQQQFKCWVRKDGITWSTYKCS